MIAFISVPISAWMANRLGKVRTLQILLAISGIGQLLVFVFYNRDHHWLAPVSVLFAAPNAAGFWTITTSMKADICDEDELINGMRREGMFGSVGNWVTKLAGSLAMLMGGLILNWTGFDIALGSEQLPETLFNMRIIFCIFPAVLAVLSILMLTRFPLTRERMAEIRTELESRRDTI